MYEYHLKTMARDMVTNGILDSKDFDKAVEVLGNHWEDKIACVWSTDDVKMCAKEKGLEIPEGNAKNILDNVLQKHDASIGVNWEIIDCHLDDYIKINKV